MEALRPEHVAYARWTALPEYDMRSVNMNTLVFTPASTIHRSAKSTSASAPAGWVCGTNTSASGLPASAAIRGRASRT